MFGGFSQRDIIDAVLRRTGTLVILYFFRNTHKMSDIHLPQLPVPSMNKCSMGKQSWRTCLSLYRCHINLGTCLFPNKMHKVKKKQSWWFLCVLSKWKLLLEPSAQFSIIHSLNNPFLCSFMHLFLFLSFTFTEPDLEITLFLVVKHLTTPARLLLLY